MAAALQRRRPRRPAARLQGLCQVGAAMGRVVPGSKLGFKVILTLIKLKQSLMQGPEV